MKLTQAQENFIVNVHSGLSQYESYIRAYPSAKKWKRSNIDKQASILMKNPKIIPRYKELKEEVTEKVNITLVEVVNLIIDMAKDGEQEANRRGAMDMLMKHLGGFEKDNKLEIHGTVQYTAKLPEKE